MGREAELLVDESDPADTWESMSVWIADSLAEAIADSFVWAHQRCERLATVVAESFRLEGDIILPHFRAIETSDMLTPVTGLDDPTTGAIWRNEASVWTLVVVSILGIVMTTRHTRLEEETSRAELVRSAPVGRHAGTSGALLGVLIAQVGVAMAVAAAVVVAG